MAVSKKGNRNINVEGHDFKWRATGNDGWISIVLWPVNNEGSRVVTSIDYHHDMHKISEGHFASNGQLVVTNRIVRELILHVGVTTILENHGQLNVGSIEEFFDVSNAVRA